MPGSYLSPQFHTLPATSSGSGGAAGPSFEVRAGSHRPVRYDFTGNEFRVGGAANCELRLAGAAVPPVVCRFVRDGEHIRIERHDEAFPILVNSQPLEWGKARLLKHGDRAAVGSVDLTLHFAEVHLHPRLDPDDAPPPSSQRAPDPELAALAERRAALEAECQALRQEAARLAELLPDLDQRKASLDAFEAELAKSRAELAEQLQQGRAQLAEAQAANQAASEALSRRTADAEAELAARAEALAGREREVAAWTPPPPPPVDDSPLVARAAELDRRAAALDRRLAELAQGAADLEAHTAHLERERSGWDAGAGERAARAESLEVRAAEAQALADALAQRELDAEEREARLAEREAKLREVGRAVARVKRELAEAREAQARELDERRRSLSESLARTEAELRAESGRLESLDAALSARERQLAEAEARHAEAARQLERQGAAIEGAAAEHRLAVAGFRQQVQAWQAEVAEAEARAAAPPPAPPPVVVAAPPPPPAPPSKAPRPARHSADDPAEREGQLAALRDWLRRRLAALAEPGKSRPRASNQLIDPADAQLAELLKKQQIADAGTAAALVAEAEAQRRPLRSLLLAGGAVTVYQLALIETGNLAALALARFAVLDRIRVTPREVVYRVADPARPESPACLLRHLSEAEMDDAVRPDEFRQRFGAARDSAHPHLAQTLEVLEIQGRPAALCEWVQGSASGDWPAEAATPAVWLHLASAAASALEATHRHGLVHGRLSGDSFVLDAAGHLKLTGVGEPMWLAMGVASALDPTPIADLRALGPVLFAWSQLAQPPGKRRTRGKAFPETLLQVVRRLESDSETPMGDTAPGAQQYADASELVADLARLRGQFPLSDADWAKFAARLEAPTGSGARATA